MLNHTVVDFPNQTEAFPHKDAEALKVALYELGVHIRYNTRAQKAEMAWGGKNWREMNDRVSADLRREIARKYSYQTHRGSAPLNYGEQSWRLWLDSLLYLVEVDPFKKWLDGLEKWDMTKRLDCWLSDVFDIQGGNTELTQWASRFIFLGCVWRTYEPGIKLDEMPVLIGLQGIGKSTALRLVLPPEMPELFNDGLHLAADPKFRAEALQGRAIVEASEMAGSTRAELESLKAFLSRTDDGGIRMAYRRNPEAMPRRCIIVGTSNNPECLPNDASGNRRFVPVNLSDGDPETLTKFMNGNRIQLWAEALYMWAVENRQAWLPRSLKVAQSKVTEIARRKDELLEHAIDIELATWGNEPIVLAGLIKAAGMEGQRNIDRRTGNYLRHKGYEKINRNNRKVWIRVENT